MGSVHSISTTKELERFFDVMFGVETGYVHSPTKHPETLDWQPHFFAWPTEKAKLISHITTAAPTHEVYFGPALFSSPGSEKEDFKGTNYVWCEFDGNAPTEIDVPEPAIKIRSSTDGHEHWYWRLENFVTDIGIVENITQRLAYHLQADLGCWNGNRVLRPPTTTHHESTLPVTVLKWEERTTYIQEFVGLQDLPTKLLIDSDINFIPDALDVIAKYSWAAESFEFFKVKELDTAPGKPKGEGYRSSALAKLGHICMEMGMSNAETLSILRNADNRWKKFAGRRDQKKQLLNIINYCRLRHPVDPIAEELQAAAEDRYKVYTYEEFKNTEIQIEWAIPGLIHKKGTVIVSGPPGVGKSQLALRLCEKLAKGEQMLKWTPERPMRTLFISMEMAHEELKQITETMDFQGDMENMLIMPIGSSINLTNKVAQAELINIMEEYKPDGVFLDSLGVAIGKELNSDQTVLETFDFVKRTVQNYYGAFVVWIHHNRKAQIGNKKPNKLEDLYGSQYIGAAVTSAIGLWPSGSSIEVNCLKMRMAEQFQPFKITRLPGLNFEVMQNRVINPGEPIFAAGELDDSAINGLEDSI